MVNVNKLSAEMQKELAFTKEELAELERAKKMPITFDEDCPETTPERALKFRRVNPAPERKRPRRITQIRKYPPLQSVLWHVCSGGYCFF